MKRTIENRLQKLELMLNDFALNISSSNTIDPATFLTESAVVETSATQGNIYLASVEEEIAEVLKTNLKTRVMRPDYGSELYKLRDREFNDAWRIWATKYTFEAINNNIDRVRCKKVYFEVQDDGKIKMNLDLEER